MLTKEQRDEIREAEKAATRGPWEAGTAMCCPDMGWVDGPAGKGRVCGVHEATKRTHTLDANDARLIALLRNHAVELLDAAEMSEATILGFEHAQHIHDEELAKARTEIARLTTERDEYKQQNSVPDILDEVERPSPIPVGAPGSNYRRAWEIGRRLDEALAEVERLRAELRGEANRVAHIQQMHSEEHARAEQAEASQRRAELSRDGVTCEPRLGYDRATLLRVAEACDVEVEAAEMNGYGQLADTYRMFAARLRGEAEGGGS